jgi:hypothetical protein
MRRGNRHGLGALRRIIASVAAAPPAPRETNKWPTREEPALVEPQSTPEADDVPVDEVPIEESQKLLITEMMPIDNRLEFEEPAPIGERADEVP